MRYAYAVYKTADSSTTLQMSNRTIVEHLEQLGTSRTDRESAIVEHHEQLEYLLGENEQADLFKDPAMLKRFQDIAILPEKDKQCLLTTVDYFIKSAKIGMM